MTGFGNQSRLALALIGAGALSVALVSGCSTSSKPEAQAVSPSDFTVGSDAAVARGQGAAKPVSQNEDPELVDFSGGMIATIAEDDLGESADVTVLTGPPVDLSARRAIEGEGPVAAGEFDEAAMIESSYVVDALVGQINGRPVIASEFFEPMAARLQRKAQEASAREWVLFARERIRAELRAQLIDQLLLAEFEASLTQEQKVGLLAFVRNLREDLISGNFGSQARAERILEEQGTSFEEKVKEDRDQMIIDQTLRTAVRDKVWVTWREVQQEYERRFDEFNSGGKARIRVIWIPMDDDERKGLIARSIADGDPFEDAALKWSDLRREQGGLFEIELSGDPYKEATLFPNDVLNDAAQQLEVGQTSDILTFNNKLVWIHLEELQQSSISLQDAQLQIYGELRGRRWSMEQQKYLAQLLERGSVSDLQEMENQLLQYAADRFITQAGG